jgi:hypothetical protein
VILDEKIKILDTLRGDTTTAAVYVTFWCHFILKSNLSRYFTLMLNYPMVRYNITQFNHD